MLSAVMPSIMVPTTILFLERYLNKKITFYKSFTKYPIENTHH
jgi:hypothetical protein